MTFDAGEHGETTPREEIRESIAMLLDLEKGTPGVLSKGLQEFRPVEIAEVLQDFDEADAKRIIVALPLESAAEVISETDPLSRESLLEAAPEEQISEIVEALPPDEGADILELLSDSERREVLGKIEPAQARELQKLEAYDPESAGGIMTTHFVAVRQDTSADEALAAVRAHPDLEAFNYVYAVDEQRRLKGVVTARELLKAPAGTRLSDIMETDVVSVGVDEDQETAAGLVSKYNFSAMPVVDTKGRIAGVVTVDDIIDVLEEEFSEDIFRLAGTAAVHPTREPVRRRILLRLPWLMVTLTGELIVSLVLRRFEHSLQAIVAIFFFLPAVNAMGGNVGIQSSTIMVRGLATGEVDFSRLLRVLFGEVRVGAAVGCFFGVLVMVVVYFMTAALGLGASAAGGLDPRLMGLSVGLAMIAGIITSALVGTLVPMLCSRVGIDPAITAGPFVTVLNDIFCTTIYLTVSTLILVQAA